MTQLNNIPELVRPRLIQKVLQSQAQWVQLYGLPTTGRSTLLRQIAESLSHSEKPLLGIWSDDDATRFCEALIAEHSFLPGLTVIVDDLDLLHDSQEFQETLRKLLRTDPSARAIVATVDPPPVMLLNAGNHGIEVLGSRSLNFTSDEIRSLLQLREDELNTAAAETLAQEIVSTSRGAALAVAIAYQHIDSGGSVQSNFTLAEAMSTYFKTVRSQFNNSAEVPNLIRVNDVATRMPRFSMEVLTKLFPLASGMALQSLLLQPGIERDNSFSAEISWQPRLWHTLQLAHSTDTSERQRLARLLNEADEPGAAFDQLCLADDLAAAERLLRRRFLTVFETLAPEVAQRLLLLASEQLRAYPFLGTLRVLLKREPEVFELQTCLEMLLVQAEKHSSNYRQLALALAALLHLRLNSSTVARMQSENVIAAQRASRRSIDDDNPDELMHWHETEVIAQLIFFASGGHAKENDLNSESIASEYLRRRRALLRDTMQAQLYEQLPKDELFGSETLFPGEFRSLIYAPVECVAEAQSWQSYDGVFRSAADDSAHGFLPAVTITDPPQITTPLRTLLESTSNTKLQSADAHNEAEPFHIWLLADQLALRGKHTEALDHLDRLADDWGPRIVALREVLRCSVLLRKGATAAAATVFARAGSLSNTLLAQAVSLLPADDADRLAALSDRASVVHKQAQAAGFLGSGKHRAAIRVTPLTSAELGVLRLLHEGLNTRQIAETQHVSIETVRTHLKHIAKKLDVRGQSAILLRTRELSLLL